MDSWPLAICTSLVTTSAWCIQSVQTGKRGRFDPSTRHRAFKPVPEIAAPSAAPHAQHPSYPQPSLSLASPPTHARTRPLFVNLEEQMRMHQIPLLTELPPPAELDSSYDLLVDAVFGFSFTGAVRPPFDVVLRSLAASSLPLLSVDIPSGSSLQILLDPVRSCQIPPDPARQIPLDAPDPPPDAPPLCRPPPLRRSPLRLGR